jgi:hypothetical protein
MPDGPRDATPPGSNDEERQMLDATVAEARAGGGDTPHAVMRERMLEMIAEARRAKAERAAAPK